MKAFSTSPRLSTNNSHAQEIAMSRKKLQTAGFEGPSANQGASVNQTAAITSCLIIWFLTL
jgi:hypothetical protein